MVLRYMLVSYINFTKKITKVNYKKTRENIEFLRYLTTLFWQEKL